jgi:retron-type reverse transcriptase
MEMTEQSGITLIQRMVNPVNIELAKKKVQQNKGAPGIDGMTVKELDAHLREYLPYFKEKLLNGTYQPQPVKRVSIPKADGSKRHLGIPCVRDRLVQQMILQIIEPEIDGYFSDNSYGFRKGRNAHQAIVKVRYRQDSFAKSFSHLV